MARSRSSNNAVKYIAGAVAVAGAAFCVGYYVIGGTRPQPTPPENLVPANVAAPMTPAPAKPLVVARSPRTQNGEYTAPGAPSIHIVEERNPSLLDTSKQQPKPAEKPADPEASQEAAPTPKTAADTTPPDAGSDSNDNTAPTPDATPATPGDGSAPSTASDTGTNTDPDTEKVSSPGPSEAGQEGVSSSKAQFRVQAGSFVAAENAKALADALRRRGYVTSTRPEKDGDKTVYKVQVGAYRTKSAADKAAQDLQSSGYPASVAPTGP